MDTQGEEPHTEAPKRRWPWQRKQRSQEEKPKLLPYFSLFRYATHTDKLYLALAVVCGALHGSLLPILTVIFGAVVDKFGSISTTDAVAGSPDFTEILEEIDSTTKWFIIVAVIAFALSFVQVRFSIGVANRIGHTIRFKYFNSLLRQDPEWYEKYSSGELTSLIDDVYLIEGGLGDKVATTVQYLSTFCVGIVVGKSYFSCFVSPLRTLLSSPCTFLFQLVF